MISCLLHFINQAWTHKKEFPLLQTTLQIWSSAIPSYKLSQIKSFKGLSMSPMISSIFCCSDKEFSINSFWSSEIYIFFSDFVFEYFLRNLLLIHNESKASIVILLFLPKDISFKSFSKFIPKDSYVICIECI